MLQISLHELHFWSLDALNTVQVNLEENKITLHREAKLAMSHKRNKDCILTLEYLLQGNEKHFKIKVVDL